MSSDARRNRYDAFCGLSALFFLLAIFVCPGCFNGNVHVTGKVVYPDGTPLTTGQVVFTDDFHLGKSDINEKGEYSLHSYRRNDGIARGIYKAYITGAMRFERVDVDSKEIEKGYLAPIVELIDRQFTNPDASGWLFDVQKNMTIDLVVYPPGQTPEEKKTEMAKYMFDPEYRAKVDRGKNKPEPGKLDQRASKPTNPSGKKRLINPNLL